MPTTSSRDSPLLIVGASTRAAAESAIRAGFAPICADMFADVDLRAIAEVLPVSDYPRGLIAATANVPRDVPLLYTGAIENHPRLVETLCRERPLLGNGPAVLSRVRDPVAVREVLTANGLPALDLFPGDGSPPSGDWLWKPSRSSAGRGISKMRGHEPGYWQRFQPGASCSAVFFAGRKSVDELNGRVPLAACPPVRERAPACTGGQAASGTQPLRSDRNALRTQDTNESGAVLIGVARQLIGLPHLPFGFAGAIAPVSVPRATQETMHRLGEVLTEEFALTGLFGVDFVLEDESPWLVEINPRYTATVELFEFAFRQPLLVSAPTVTCPTQRCFGKRILYAESRLVAGDLTQHVRSTVSFDIPAVADIPEPSQVIEAGQPICTVYAEAGDVDECARKLSDVARRLRSNQGERGA